LGTLIEFLPSQPGIGEVHLLRPALSQLAAERSITLVHPPYMPHFHCWVDWQLQARRLLWINPGTQADALWATEQVLRHNSSAAVFCWAHPIRSASLRRLQLLARQSDTLCIILRPSCVLSQASAAVLRLALQPSPQGMQLHIIKRQGAAQSTVLTLQLYAASRAAVHQHASMDLPEMA